MEPSPCPIPEGQECPTCMRRVPHAKKGGSPQTKVISTRVPVGDADEFKELLKATARHAGTLEKKHWQYWTILKGLVLLLQGPPGDAA